RRGAPRHRRGADRRGAHRSSGRPTGRRCEPALNRDEQHVRSARRRVEAGARAMDSAVGPRTEEMHMAGDLYYFTFLVPEVDRARTFWSGLFGWEYEDSGPDAS